MPGTSYARGGPNPNVTLGTACIIARSNHPDTKRRHPYPIPKASRLTSGSSKKSQCAQYWLQVLQQSFTHPFIRNESLTSAFGVAGSMDKGPLVPMAQVGLCGFGPIKILFDRDPHVAKLSRMGIMEPGWAVVSLLMCMQ